MLFNTNGTLLNERSGRALTEAGLDKLRVSLDAATRETFKAVRGKDYFERILANVRRFRTMQEREGATKPRVSLWLTGLKDVAELPDFVRIAADLGGEEVYLQRLVFFNRDSIGLARPDQALFEQMLARSRAAFARQRISRANSEFRARRRARPDVDAYIALVPPEEQYLPHRAQRSDAVLLAAGRAAEALAVLERAKPKRSAVKATRDDDLYLIGLAADNEWEETYVEALEATGQKDEAQRLRSAAFEERLSADQLRAYLKRLPDFDDVEAEERAMKHALGSALGFFTEWPDQARAAQLVLARASEIDGNLYYLLDPTARLIEGKHPLAATLLRHAMIEDTLDGAKSTRYKHAARHLLECRSLAASIRDFGEFETHEAFVSRLRARHGRKTGFWSQVSEVTGG